MYGQKRRIIAKRAECPTKTALTSQACSLYHQRHTEQVFSSLTEPYQDKDRRKSLKLTSLRLEKELWAWIQEQEKRNIFLSRQLIEMKARELQGNLCELSL